MAKGTLFGKPRNQVIKRPGAFKKKAKAAGKSVSEEASDVLKQGSKASTRTKKQAALAKAFATMRKKKGGGKSKAKPKKSKGPSDNFLKQQYKQGQTMGGMGGM